MELKFKNPPISELIIGVYFSPPLLNFRSEHVGLFWASIRKEFPACTQQFPLNNVAMAPGEPFPMPRYWFLSKDEVTLLQVQRDAILFNWRKRPTDKADYPQYKSLKAKFDEYYDRFASFLQQNTQTPELIIERCELAYVNVIEPTAYWKSIADTDRIIPTFRMIDCGLKEAIARDVTQRTVFSLAEDMLLAVSVQNRRVPEGRPDVLHFELRVTGQLGAANKFLADAWFERAHDATGLCFTSMTDPDIQIREWQPKGRNDA